jgi:hypothetical protein
MLCDQDKEAVDECRIHRKYPFYKALKAKSMKSNIYH